MVHRSGSIELIRASLVRALMAPAVLAGALMLAGCYGDDGYQIPTRAMKELSPEMLTLLEQKNMPKDSPILVRLFKEESELEVWKQDTTGHFELLKVYPICRWSGDLGPKVREGDRQAPEGFYQITPGLMNPNSNYYLAINIGFPNAYDKANNRSGAFLMIHGDCSSRGCYAMTDEEIGEIYSLARESFLGGQQSFQIEAFPFRMTPANLARHRDNPNYTFWKMIKEGDDHFLVSHIEPKVNVCDRHYVFDAVPAASSTRALVFNPTGRCPAFQTDPQIADQALAKQRNDEYQLAQLISRNVPTAPLETGTDGGMNRVFAAKLENATYTYDNEGHLHVPPLQEGRLPPAISPPQGSESDTTPAIAAAPGQGGASFSSLFSGMFASKPSAPPAQPAQVASADAQSHSGLFGSLFSSKRDAATPSPAATSTQTADAAPAAKPKAVARNDAAATASLRLKPATEPHKGATQEADAAKTKAPPEKEANVATPPASNGGVISGAQPVLPTGSFDARWSSFGNQAAATQ
jgi:murein L,D-transpeptidase YafK